MATESQGRTASGKGKTTPSGKRLILILSESALVLVLLAVWVLSRASEGEHQPLGSLLLFLSLRIPGGVGPP